MITKLFEATQDVEGSGNYGKFLVCIPDSEWLLRTELAEEYSFGVLRSNGWGRSHVLVIDLATGEGGRFRLGGHAGADLNKHRIWVCPLFEPFLWWLYKQTPEEIPNLPQLVLLPGAAFSYAGYRRSGLPRMERGLGWPVTRE